MIKGMSVQFSKRMASGKDALGDDTFTIEQITVDDVLIAPITEPANAREAQALEQSRDQVRVHLPKTNNRDISDSEFIYDGKTFRVDSSSVQFMNENTPTRWNKYFRAESITG